VVGTVRIVSVVRLRSHLAENVALSSADQAPYNVQDKDLRITIASDEGETAAPSEIGAPGAWSVHHHRRSASSSRKSRTPNIVAALSPSPFASNVASPLAYHRH
jgi:hypothetical protein